jgi:hypothetical protein
VRHDRRLVIGSPSAARVRDPEGEALVPHRPDTTGCGDHPLGVRGGRHGRSLQQVHQPAKGVVVEPPLGVSAEEPEAQCDERVANRGKPQ